MAYLSPKFEHDIFLSYARVDNHCALDDEGWVDSFRKLLETELSKLVGRLGLVKIWMDVRHLGPGQYFDDEIRNAIRASGVFLALTSRGYLHSDCYCRHELKEFFQKAQESPESLRVGTRSRIVNALLYNIHHDDWPPEYKGIGAFKLFDASETDLGDPSRATSELFKSQVKELARELYKLLDEYKKSLTPPTPPPPPPPPGVEPRVFLADTTESLTELRSSIVNALKKEGIETFARTPPPYLPVDHDLLVTERIASVDLAVHLFDSSPGEKYIDGDGGKTFLQRQAELALKHAKSQYIWVPPKALVDIPSIKDDGYREFLSGLENGERDKNRYTFQREPASSVPEEIIKKLKEIRGTGPSNGCQPQSALLETHRKDQLHALELYPVLLDKELQTFINPDGDDPSSNYEAFQKLVRQISVLIIIFGTVASDWVRERLLSSLQLAATIEPRRLKLCGIYAPPGPDGAERQMSLGSFPGSIPVFFFDNRNTLSQLIDLVLGGAK